MESRPEAEMRRARLAFTRSARLSTQWAKKTDRMTHFTLRARIRAIFSVGLAFCAATSVLAQSPSAPSSAQADDIVVTAQRSGIPVWRVTGPTTTIVLVGSIKTVAAGTKWDPAPLEAALAKADRIMFPETSAISVGVFSAIGAVSKWRKQASLPKGQTLQMLTTPDQYARLVALRNKGVLKAGFERKHPFHLAMTLQTFAAGKRGLAADNYVRRTARKNKLKMVPVAQLDAKAVMAEFFGSAPKRHVPCLMDAVMLAEAGPGAVKARSDAWAGRRVPAALASVAARVERSCWPVGSRFEAARNAGLGGAVRRLMAQQQVTVAVISLDSLAKSGGILDDLDAAGFDVRGPRWKS